MIARKRRVSGWGLDSYFVLLDREGVLFMELGDTGKLGLRDVEFKAW